LPRLEEPLSAPADEAATHISSHDAVSPPAPADAPTAAHANEDPVKGTRAMGPWTPGEDTKLTTAVTNTFKKKWGQENIIDWVAIAALVPGRTKKQCRHRWNDALHPSIDQAPERPGKLTEDEDVKLKNAVQTCWNNWRDVLDPSIDRATGRSGTWTTDEDIKLTDAVQLHNGKNWDAIAALVPGRTKEQSYSRWHNVLDLKGGCWTAVEDSNLKDAVHTNCGNNWAAIAALIPCRTKSQCSHRWHNVLNPIIDRANGRKGKWAEVEDRGPTGTHPSHHPGHYIPPQQMPVSGMYQRQMYPGMPTMPSYPQMYPRMPNMPPYPGMPYMSPNMMLRPGGMPYYPGQGDQMPYLQYGYEDDARASGAPEEDAKLTNVVTNGSKKELGKECRTDWAAATVLVPGQTLHSSIDWATGRTGTWAEDEDIKLKNAVQTYGGNNWAAVAALIPGRTKEQCCNRWRKVLDPSIDRSTELKGVCWTAVEDSKLKDAVQTHCGKNCKNWAAIAALVPGRTEPQCRDRWYNALNPNIALTARRTCGQMISGQMNSRRR
jgi:hypothetical protein